MDPLAYFADWLAEARAVETSHGGEAVTLATCNERGRPSVRMVFFRGLREGGFSFFTNYESRKGRELARQPQAALLFYWPALHRQVRVGGSCARLSREVSEAYFAGRSRESQISAWASRQSERLESEEALALRIAEQETRFRGGLVPCPEFWGGYRLVPDEMEFWTSGSHRRHERLAFCRTAEGWESCRLYP